MPPDRGARGVPVALPRPDPDDEIRVQLPGDVTLRVLVFRGPRAASRRRILLVPGLLAFVESWTLVVAELAREFDVLYFESREKASSCLPRRSRFRIEELVADLAATVRRLELAPGTFDVVASCLGAATVLHAYVTGAIQPRRMVWVTPVLRPGLPWIVKPLGHVLRGPLYRLLQRLAIAWYRRYWNPPTHDAFQHSRFMDVVGRADPWKATAAARDVHGVVVDPALAEGVRIPMLVIAASRDRQHAVAESRQLAARLPDARLEDLVLFWRTRTPAAGRLIVRFLTGPDPRSERPRSAGDAATGRGPSP